MAIDGGSVEIRFEGDVTPLRRSIEEVVSDLNEVSEASSDADSKLSDAFHGFGKNAKQEFDEFAESATDSLAKVIDSSDTLIASLGGIGSALSKIVGGAVTVGLASATKGLINMSKGAINDTSALEKVQIQMIGLTHSVEKGNKAMAMAVKYFKNNPFNRFEVTNATKSLIQFGANLEEIPELLDKLGKVALSTGANIDTMAYYYQRNISDGRIATRDLLQMQNQGIPIFQALAKQMNVTSGAVRELAAKGKVSIEDFQKAFDALVDDQAMERFNNTFARQVDRFKGRISNMRAALAGYSTSEEGGLEISSNGLYRAVTQFIRTFADIMDSDTGKRIYSGFEKLGNAIARVIDKITSLMKPAMEVFGKFLNFIGDNSELLIPLLGGLAVALTNVASAIPGIGGIINKVKSPFTALVTNIQNLIKLSPGLTAFLGILAIGFKEAYQNDEEFRKTIQELGQALKDIISTIMTAGRGAFQALMEVIKELASSGVIKGVLQGVASALKVIAQAIASIPPEVLAGLMSFILSLKLLNASPISYAIMLIGMLVSYVKELGDLPTALKTIGHNMMTGLVNGLKEGATKVFNFIKDVASTIISTFKNMFGIHSPSTVMYEMGQNIGLGLANGITDSESYVQVAMNNLASDILKAASKVISNKSSFGLLNYKDTYKEWKKISRLFVEGSEQYNEAIENMEEARKNANLKILELQKSYNDTLDSTIKKISSMYGLFSDVDLSGGKNASQILKGLDQQVAKLQEWASAQEAINETGLDPKLIEELQSMGVDSVAELSAIAGMTSDELTTLNDLWLKKQQIANNAGVKQMESLKEDTLEQINELKDGIDGATIDIADVGGRLVESISEGVYGAMPTLESAFAQLDEYIEKAKRSMGSGTDVNAGNGGEENTEENLIAGVKEEITASMEKLKSMLPNILLGAIGAWGAVKFGPKILKAIFNKIGSGLLGTSSTLAQGIAGSLFKSADLGFGLKQGLLEIIDKIPREEYTVSGKLLDKVQDWLTPKTGGAIQEAAKNASKVSKPAESIAKSSTQISQSISTTGQSFSKASSWMSSIKQGAQTIIWIAGAIAAVAGALWVTYNALKDVDFGKLAVQLIAMGLAVVEFGALAKVADMLQVSAKNILVIAGLAADIAVVALACKVAYELMNGIDFGRFQLVLLEMAEALAVMGVLTTAAGALMELTAGAMAIGMLAVAGLAADIALVAVAIKAAYDVMEPINFDKFQLVILEMIEALGVMGGFSALFGLLAPLEFLGWASIIMICDELCKTADALYKVYTTVPDDFDGVNKKIDLIKSVLQKMIDTNLGELIKAIITVIEIGPLERTVEGYTRIAEQLGKMSEINIDAEKVNENIEHVKNAIEKVKTKTGVIEAVLRSWADEAAANSVESAGKVLKTYGEIADVIGKIGDVEIKGDVTKSVEKMTDFVQQVLDTISNVSTRWGVNVGDIEKNIGYAESILNKFTEILPTVQNQIVGKGLSTEEVNDALNVISGVSTIVEKIGTVTEAKSIKKKEETVGYAQSILNKFTGILPTVKQLVDEGIDENQKTSAINTIEAVRDLVYQIGKVNETRSIENKEKIVGYTQSILNKFTGIIPTIGQLVQEAGEVNLDNAPGVIEKVRDLVWQIGQINQKGGDSLENKSNILDKSIEIAKKLKDFAQAAKEISIGDTSVINQTVESVNTILTGISTSFNDNIVVFENIGAKIGESLSNGIDSQKDFLEIAGGNIQSAIWHGVNNKIDDEYWQGVSLAQKFGEGLKSVSFENIGAQMQSSLWQSIQDRMQDEYYQGQALGQTFRQGLYDVDYANSGWWAVQGFINGVYNRGYYSGADNVWNVGYNLANAFLNGLKARAGEGSPWKSTMESGNWAIEGLIDGLKQSENSLVMEAESIADKLVDTLSMDDLTISPTLDPAVSTPGMVSGEYGMMNNNSIVINQEVTAYTPYDIDAISRDLAWQLSTI